MADQEWISVKDKIRGSQGVKQPTQIDILKRLSQNFSPYSDFNTPLAMTPSMASYLSARKTYENIVNDVFPMQDSPMKIIRDIAADPFTYAGASAGEKAVSMYSANKARSVAGGLLKRMIGEHRLYGQALKKEVGEIDPTPIIGNMEKGMLDSGLLKITEDGHMVIGRSPFNKVESRFLKAWNNLTNKYINSSGKLPAKEVIGEARSVMASAGKPKYNNPLYSAGKQAYNSMLEPIKPQLTSDAMKAANARYGAFSDIFEALNKRFPAFGNPYETKAGEDFLNSYLNLGGGERELYNKIPSFTEQSLLGSRAISLPNAIPNFIKYKLFRNL